MHGAGSEEQGVRGGRSADAGIVRDLAGRMGFDLVGIAEAERLGPESEHLREWLSRGYQATMKWMDRSEEKRADPAGLLENAKSVISLARNYYTPFKHADGTAKISRYAWGDDYHLVIGDALGKMVEELRAGFPGNKFTWYCDTGPLMDKAWAQRAGIGWIGKHTNVINRSLGSWFFLAEIITDLDLEPDEPAVDHCGSCRACIDACPTGAIVGPYVLDSNKCISFLTIENREDSIPDELMPKLDNWLFGCDICQDVCPWNLKFETPTDSTAFRPRAENLNLKASDVHLMNREEFAERFRRSPVKRAKYEGLQRNAKALSVASQSERK